MTISSTNRKAGPYAGNDVSVAFPFAFKVFSTSDVVVYFMSTNSVESVLALGSNYSITLNSDQEANPGGTVTLPVALATGTKLTITSDVAELQPVTLTNNGGFYPRVINDALDRATIQIQQLREKLSRALVWPISSSTGSLPVPVGNTVIGWNAAGTALVNIVLSAGSSMVDLAQAAGSSLIGFIQSGVGAEGRDVEEKLREIELNILDFATTADRTSQYLAPGLPDLTYAAQAALAHAIATKRGEVVIPDSEVRISDTLVMNTGAYTQGIGLRGKGRNSKIRQYGTGKDAIHFSTTQFLQNSYIRDVQLVTEATAGHVINIVYGCTCCQFDNVEMVQGNPAKAIIYGDYTSFGGGVYDTKFRGGSWYCAAVSTEAGVRIKANGTIFNENVFENIRCYNANTLQFFHITTNTTPSIWLTNNTFRNINFEMCKAGGVLFTSAKGWLLQNINFWDAGGAYTNNLIDMVAGAGYESASNTLMNISRNGDSLAGGVNDIRIVIGQDTTIINCYTSASPVYDFSGKRVTVIGPLGGTINNKGAMLWVGGQLGGIQFPGTLSGALMNYYDEGTFTATLTGSVSAPTTPITVAARYTRIGRQVLVEGVFSGVNTTGASGNTLITGLPFACGAIPGQAKIMLIGIGTAPPAGSVSGTDIKLSDATNAAAGLPIVAGVGKTVYFSASYTV